MVDGRLKTLEKRKQARAATRLEPGPPPASDLGDVRPGKDPVVVHLDLSKELTALDGGSDGGSAPGSPEAAGGVNEGMNGANGVHGRPPTPPLTAEKEVQTLTFEDLRQSVRKEISASAPDGAPRTSEPKSRKPLDFSVVAVQMHEAAADEQMPGASPSPSPRSPSPGPADAPAGSPSAASPSSSGLSDDDSNAIFEDVPSTPASGEKEAAERRPQEAAAAERRPQEAASASVPDASVEQQFLQLADSAPALAGWTAKQLLSYLAVGQVLHKHAGDSPGGGADRHVRVQVQGAAVTVFWTSKGSKWRLAMKKKDRTVAAQLQAAAFKPVPWRPHNGGAARHEIRLDTSEGPVALSPASEAEYSVWVLGINAALWTAALDESMRVEAVDTSPAVLSPHPKVALM